MNKIAVASELVKVARGLVSGFGDDVDKQRKLMKQAEGMGIKFIFKDKYDRGKKTIGPRNWRKVNIEELERAIENKENQVTLLRG